MQTNLEIKGISKRVGDTLLNSTKKFGVKGNETKGYSSLPDDEYNINGEDAKKGGESDGTLSNHLNKGFDLSTGGDSVDKKSREIQQAYVIPGQITYSKENYYSDADDNKIDTSGNIGQIIIY